MEPTDSGFEPVGEDTAQEPCSDPEGTASASPSSLVGRLECGEALFGEECAICHQEDGSGGDAGSPLLNRLDDYSDEELYDAIKTGEGTMPPQDLSPQQLADIVVFLREAM